MSLFDKTDEKSLGVGAAPSQTTGLMEMIFSEVKTTAKEIDPFSGVTPPENNDWSIPEAYMCILIAAVRADNKVEPEEVEYVKALVKRCKTLRGYGTNALAQINMSVSERMQKRPDYLTEACHALPRDMHIALFAHCVDISLADGDLDPKERVFLDSLIDKMSITKEQAKQVVEVIFEKNRH